MVSLKAIFERYKIFCLLVSLFILGGAVQSFAIADPSTVTERLLCLNGKKACCVDGTMTCVDEDDTDYKWCLTSCGGDTGSIIDPIETCTSGQVQYKPSGACGTSSRTCCSGGSWSGWDAECPKTCDSSTKPATSQSCGTNGTQTRSVTCNTSTGTWTEGSWGTCKEQVCTPNEVGACPTNCYQRRKCNSAGTEWGSCYCENKDEIWSVTLNYQNTVQSNQTCEAHCCCDGDLPVANVYNKYLGKNVGTGCLDSSNPSPYQYYCSCKTKDGAQTGYTGTQSQCLR